MFSDFEKFYLLATYDFVFKKRFEGHKYQRMSIHFLNSVMQYKGTIIAGETIKTDIYPEITVDKWSGLDVLAKTASGGKDNVDVQSKDENNILEKSLFCWNRLFASQLKEGDSYKILKKTISIIILNFSLFKTDDRFWRKCYIKDDPTNTSVSELREIHFPEAAKVKGPIKNSQLSMRLAFLRNPYSKEIIVLKNDITKLNETKSILPRIHIEPKAKEYWQVEGKAICDEAFVMANAAKRVSVRNMAGGVKQGREKGIADVMEKGRGRAIVDVAVTSDSLGIPKVRIKRIAGKRNG